MINGKNYSWEDITIQLPYGTLIDIEDIEYSDEKETEANYGKGSNPTGYGEGNYSANGKLTLKREEFQRLLDYVKKNSKTLYGLDPFPIIVSYANDDQPTVTDKLPLCKFTSTKNGSSQNDKKVNVELEFIILKPIEWDGTPAN
ncbi:MAG: hypothetical protein PWR10_1539 [Halanaerobiales bacterium]|nr:hypothetical protein [Halanaerobiales bacterium]